MREPGRGMCRRIDVLHGPQHVLSRLRRQPLEVIAAGREGVPPTKGGLRRPLFGRALRRRSDGGVRMPRVTHFGIMKTTYYSLVLNSVFARWCFSLAVALTLASSTDAGTHTWTGTGVVGNQTRLWSDPLNWNGGPPSPDRKS